MARRPLIAAAVFISLAMAIPAAHAKCGALLVYNSAPYTGPEYEGVMPQRDYQTWGWNYSSPREAVDASLDYCKRKLRGSNSDAACDNVARWTVFCRDPELVRGWGVPAGNCGAILQCDDDISWQHSAYAYGLGVGSTKQAARRNAEHDLDQRHFNPVGHCEWVATVCND